MANCANTTFDNWGYQQAKQCCQWTAGYNDRQKCCTNALPALPSWPPRGGSRLYPVIDRTQDAYPVIGVSPNINAYRDILTGHTSDSFAPEPAQLVCRGMIAQRVTPPCGILPRTAF